MVVGGLAGQVTRADAELVAGLEVRRTDNVLGGTRKVGPDIGRRIYTVLTQRSEDTLLTTK